jgi:curved DNA-binding protein CbpA
MEEFEQLPAEVLSLLRDRIGRGLDERPLRLDPATHRQRVGALLTRLGGATFYELLGVDLAASPEEVHAAYDEVARMVHPRHAERVGLEGREAALEVLFERATRAYLTLSLPERRKHYDAEMLPTSGRPAAATGADATARAAEQHALARQYFERAAQLAQNGEVHTAIELLELAIHAEARPEYFHLLGDLQAKNPYWLRDAAASYRRAQQLGAKDPALAAALRTVEERLAKGVPEPGEEREEEVLEVDDEEPARRPLKFSSGVRRPLRTIPGR